MTRIPKKNIHLKEPAYCYWIDPKNSVVDINCSMVNYWDQFALENEGYGALTEAVLGRELYEMIEGVDTQYTMQRLVDEVRKDGVPVVEGYRCDSPGMKREMEMTVVRDPNSLIKFTNRVLKVAPHIVELNAVAVSEDITGLPEAIEEQLFARCSFCQKYQAPGDNRWVEPEHLELDPDECSDILVTYGVCLDCNLKLLG